MANCTLPSSRYKYENYFQKTDKFKVYLFFTKIETTNYNNLPKNSLTGIDRVISVVSTLGEKPEYPRKTYLPEAVTACHLTYWRRESNPDNGERAELWPLGQSGGLALVTLPFIYFTAIEIKVITNYQRPLAMTQI